MMTFYVVTLFEDLNRVLVRKQGLGRFRGVSVAKSLYRDRETIPSLWRTRIPEEEEHHNQQEVGIMRIRYPPGPLCLRPQIALVTRYV